MTTNFLSDLRIIYITNHREKSAVTMTSQRELRKFLTSQGIEACQQLTMTYELL